MSRRLNSWGGFTLLELMIVIAVVAILLAIAYPSYRAYVIRAARSEGIDALMAAAVCQERIFSRTNAYDPNQCGSSTSNGRYTITVTTANSNQEFLLTATPQGSQADDSCGVLTVDQKGARQANGAGGATAARCWSGKYFAASS